MIRARNIHSCDPCHRSKCSSPPGPPGPAGPAGPLSTYVYARDRFVDPIGGSDANNGGVTTPFQTIAAALASIGPTDTNNRYNIHIFPGPVTEPPIIWRPWVSLFGTGKDSTIINSDLFYIALPDPDIFNPPRFNFSNVNFTGTTTIDLTASINTNIRFVDGRLSTLNYTSNVAYATNPNNLFLESTQLVVGTVNGGLYIYDNNGIFTSLTILNGNVPPFVEIVGGLVQGTVTLNGNAQLFTTGVEFIADVISNNVGGVFPFWQTSADSVTTGTITGPDPVQIVDTNNVVAGLNYSSFLNRITGSGVISDNFTVTKETFVPVDASSGPVTIIMPTAANYVGREIIIKKVDPSVNTVTIVPSSGTIDGLISQIITTQYAGIRIESNSIEYFIIGTI